MIKKSDDNNTQKEYRKNLCKTLNTKLNNFTNQKSNCENTVLFISLSKLNKGKIITLNKILKSKYKCIIGIDKKCYNNDNEFNNSLKEYSNFIINDLQSDIKLFYNTTKAFLDDNLYKKKYGKKIENYNGRWKDNPSKFGTLEWFNRSKYEYIWYLEDDVFCKDIDKFISNYNNYVDDIICKIDYNHLPFWYYNNWRVGDYNHGFELANLFVARYSKQFVKNFFHFINIKNSTSHHEILTPYILNYYHMRYSNFKKIHLQTLQTNGGRCKFYNFSDKDVSKFDSEIFHPFKIT